MRRLLDTLEPPTSIYPWNAKAWALAFRTTGVLGFALLALLLGAMIQYATPDGGGPGHSPVKILVLVRGPMCLLALLLLLFRPRTTKLHLSDTRLLFLCFGALYLVSTLWSAIKIETLGKSVEILLATITFLEVSRMPDPIERVNALKQIALLTISLIATVTVIGYLIHAPGYVQARGGLFTSTTAQAPFLSGNGLGYVSSALFLVIFADWHAHKLKTGSAVCQMMFAMGLFSVSASRTSFVILLLSILLIVGRRSKVFALSLGFVMLLLITVFQPQISVFLHGRESSADFSTLSGRTVVWTAAIRQFHQRPFLGAGGGVGGKQVLGHIGNFSLQTMSSLHNGFMELLTGLGVVGSSLCVFLLIWVTIRTWRTWEAHPEHSGTYALVIHVWLTTIMSTGIFGWMGYEMVFFLCIMTNIDLVRRAEIAGNAALLKFVDAGELIMLRGDAADAYSYMSEERAAST
ncbi:MAG TPA: O-antigen ligase family protein [Terriglobales bacterium]|nr:O-antigen ligase family protein [Terriglobales bacterium]